MGRWCSGNIFASKSKDTSSILVRPAKLFWLCVIAKVFDIVTTIIAVCIFGSDSEANPLVRVVIEKFGMPIAMTANVIMSIILLYTLFEVCKKKLVLIVVCVILWAVVINNVVEILRGIL